MKIYILRHGESEYNVKHLINCNPRIKVHLTEKGKKQVGKLAKRLSGMRFDAIYTSPFPRAVETAEILNKTFKVKITKDKRLGEMKIGFEGKDAKYYFDAVKKFGDHLDFKAENGESYADVKNRVQKFLEDLKKTKHARVLIVTHEMGVRVARAIFNELGDHDTISTPIPNAKPFMFDL